MNKFLKMAFQHSMDHDYGDLEYNLCAIIVRGGSVLSVGFNKRQTNGFVEHYTDKIRGINREWHISTHAEMDAVLQARNKTDLRGAKIYVIRKHLNFQKADVFGMSRPCNICENVLKAYGVKKAYYTIDDNHYGMMTPGKSVDKIIRIGFEDEKFK